MATTKPKIYKGDLVRHAGWKSSDGTIQGKGRLYYVVAIQKERRWDPIKQTFRLERWAVLRSVKRPQYIIRSRTLTLKLVRKAER